jgi:cell shape-determining protein MreD
MSWSVKLKINIFIIFVIFAKYLAYPIHIGYVYSPEILSIVIYSIYSINKKILSYINLILISILNDIIGLSYVGVSLVQYMIYAYYINKLHKKYIAITLLVEWLLFFLLNIILIPCKYTLLNILQGHDVILSIFLEKALITIACFPIIYYLASRFINNYNSK